MDRRILALGAAITLLGTGATLAQAEAPKPVGYLGDAGPDTIRILPPAPTPGTIRYQADRSAFLATRSLKDTPRWDLAKTDDNLDVVKHLSCAVGVELNATNAPKFTALLTKIRPDIGRATNVPKDFYKRQRPFLVDKGPTCIDQGGFMATSPDYPSGHVTYGWTIGLITAELVPDRATEVLVRARAYGESRMVCGVHNMSAVESGRTNASALVAALHGSAEFRKDLDAARAEVAKARKSGTAPDPVACAAEAELTKTSPYN